MKLGIDTRVSNNNSLSRDDKKANKKKEDEDEDKENESPIIDTLEAEKDYNNIHWDQVLNLPDNNLRLDQYMKDK
jgi:hypothetical protein